MTTWLNVKNNAESALASAITAAATSLTLITGDGAKFPASNFNISIDDEILLCSSRSGDVLTVTRAQEGTVAAAHVAGAIVALNITAAIIQQLQDHTKEISAAVNKTANQSIPHATTATITFDNEEWDTDNIHDNTTNNGRLTCKTAGRYFVFALLAFEDNVTGDRIASVKKNGITELMLFCLGKDAFGRWRAAMTTVADLAVNDYIELQVYQDSGIALNVTTDTRFGMMRMPF